MITHDELIEILRYEPETGDFIWLVNRGKAREGARAGNRQSGGYLQVRIRGRNYYAHRLAFLYVHKRWPSQHIDHINGIPYDNRIANLREATPGQNMHNSVKPKNNTSGYKGVSLEKRTGRWRASIKVNNKIRHLGTYDTPEEAYEAYKEAAKKLHGEFARFD